MRRSVSEQRRIAEIVTPTINVKRRVVNEVYATTIDDLYSWAGGAPFMLRPGLGGRLVDCERPESDGRLPPGGPGDDDYTSPTSDYFVRLNRAVRGDDADGPRRPACARNGSKVYSETKSM